MSNQDRTQPFLVEVTESFTKRIIVWAESEEDAYFNAENLCNENVVDATSAVNGDFDFSRNCNVVGNANNILGRSYGYPEYHTV